MIHFDNHAFKGFDRSLKGLFDLLLTMGDHVEELIGLLPVGLDSANAEAHAKAKVIDKEINASEVLADKAVADIVGKFTPIAEELRFILGSVKIAGALERLADRIKNCSKRLAKVQHPLDSEIKQTLTSSINALKPMISLGLDQVVDYKPEISIEMLRLGAEVQRCYRLVLLRLNQLQLDAEHSHHVLLVAKNLDQASDMAVEIMKIGHYINLGSKYEKAS